MEIGVRLQGLWLDGLESLGVQVEGSGAGV